jgi:anti-anti-sigma regulatory factor
VIYVDSSGADSLMSLHRACRKRGVRLIVCGLMHQPLDMARRCGFTDAVPSPISALTWPPVCPPPWAATATEG